MKELRRRLDLLPAALRDGTWTRCTLLVRGPRVHFAELPGDLSARQRRARLRRLTLALLGLACYLAIPLASGLDRQAVLGLVGLLFELAALDGLRRDLHAREHPLEFAVIDFLRQEVNLLRPDGGGLTVPLPTVDMFLLVSDPQHRVCHIGVVVEEWIFLPWLHTRSTSAAGSLTWLLGYLADRPARFLVTSPPILPDEVASAQPLVPPVPPLDATA